MMFEFKREFLETLKEWRQTKTNAYKFTAGNVGVVGNKITLPHYMVMFLSPEVREPPAFGMCSTRGESRA